MTDSPGAPPRAPGETTRLPLLSIALASAAALAYEVLLTRLFSIVQWHHFAYMAISIALLGFGASGTLLALAPALSRRFVPAYTANLLLFGIAAVPCFLLAQRFAVHPEALLWDPLQMLRVSAVYLLLALPFFFVANAIGLALMHFAGSVPRVYAADLLGAGLGSVAVIGLLYLVQPGQALQLVGAGALVAAVVAVRELRLARRHAAAVVVLAVSVAAAWQLLPAAWSALQLSPYKALSQQLQVVDARTLSEHSSPLGLLSVVHSPTVPLRHAPGLSLNSGARLPEQRGVFVDGEGPITIDAYRGPADATWLDDLTSALPYHLRAPGRVLVLGAGGGTLVRQALHHGVSEVTAVELDPALVALVRDHYGEFTGQLYAREEVSVEVADARGFVARTNRRYDLVQVARLGSLGTASAGLHALNENYLYTVEALREYYEQLAPGGHVAINGWVKLPPRDTLKLFATAVAALRSAGVERPGAHLLLIRNWQTSTLLIKRGEFSAEDKAAARRFCATRGFDVAWYEGMPEQEANRNNVLPAAWFHQGARALLGDDAEAYLADYKFDLRPATDDRPYFGRFVRWRSLPEILGLRGRGGVPLLESGYLLLLATLVQALLLSLLLVIAPLAGRIRRAAVRPARMSGYFSVLGLAFLFVEIAFIQKFLLFLHHPVLAVAAVLGGFLVFAGLGSQLAGRLRTRLAPERLLAGVALLVGLLAALYALLLPALVFAPLAGSGLAVKLAVSLALVALLAVPMGMPFALGLARLAERAPPLIPVAWAINGCASVVSAVLATLLAMHLGFTIVVLLAAGLYLAAAWLFRF